MVEVSMKDTFICYLGYQFLQTLGASYLVPDSEGWGFESRSGLS